MRSSASRSQSRGSSTLGFAVPYLHDGQLHDYLPDFIIRLENGVHLILETKGYDPLEHVKAAAAQRWVAAVNADGRFGEWRYTIVHDIGAVRPAIDRALT
jgi:type III restriction enzyme